MNIDYFRSFVETVNQKSLSKASERLNISQPALSKQIRKLEDFFDAPLLVRSTSGVVLTEAGELVYKRLPQILGDLSTLQNDLNSLKEIRSYRVGTLPSLAGNYIPSRILKLKENGIHVEVVIKNASQEVFELLKNGEIDAAIIEEMPVNKTYWQKEIFEEPLYAIFRTSHLLSEKQSVLIEEISDEEFVLYPSFCTIRESVSRMFQEQEKELKIIREIDFGDFLIGYVAAGSGITVVPEMSIKNLGNSFVKAIPLNHSLAKRTISLIANSSTTGKALYPFFKKR
ncbi:LysR family transcriptional regulator [Neobacillus sp. GCM10023253]|uniref:LysR family transcriptional regulator n=1 Tax=Neobacillus sp. GCM10023253 TaxID=3252644 RepID=UPI00362370BF